MNKLRWRLSVFSSGSSFKPTLSIIQPTSEQSINTDISFNVSASTNLEDGGKVSILTSDGILLGTYTVANGEISGILTVPNYIVGIGTTYFVEDGVETPVNNIIDFDLVFKAGSVEEIVTVKLQANRSFEMGTSSANIKTQADFIRNFEFDEFEAKGNIEITD